MPEETMKPEIMSTENFKYYRACVDKDKGFHDEQLSKYNCPEEVIAGYNGIFANDKGSQVENYLFIGAATALPSLFWQLPKTNIRPKNRPSLAFEAAVLTSLINASISDAEKQENQLCIIDAFLPYGYAVMKNGYNSRTGKIKTPSLLTGESKSDKTNDMEGDVEYIKFEKAISLRQSPKVTYLDSTQPFGKGNRITFIYDRTLQQIIDSNLYDLSSNFLSRYRSRDNRLIEMKLVEHWCMLNGYAWKLAYVEGWDEPLKWVKTEYRYLPVSLLKFNQMGDVLYAVSHGTLGHRAQTELNYLNELWKEKIDKIRSQHIVFEEGLSESGKTTLKANDFGAIVGATKPLIQGIVAEIKSTPIDPALFNNIASVRQYLQLIMSTAGGKGGGPDSDLATVERDKALGNALRSSGMQDAIRDFMIDQIKQRIKCFLTFGTPEMIVKMTGENLTMPTTGKAIAVGDELQLGGDNGLILKDIISGDIDVDFVFDVDIQSASRPDYPVIRKQLGEGMLVGSKLAPIIRSENKKKIRFDLQLIDYYATFDAIPDATKYVENMTEEEIQADTMKIAMAQGGGMPQGGASTEGAIEQGANKVATGAEGLQ